MENNDALNEEIAELEALNQKPFASRLGYYASKSGPGWLQGAITLGGGSLAGSLYLGVVMGYNMMWLQPFAMILGVIMLSAISYVTLSIEKKPFGAIKHHISPALAWGWLIATILANIVWCLPQFALGTAAIQKNLIPSLDTEGGKIIIPVILFIIGTAVVWSYNSGSKGIKLFELTLKILVGIVVLSFFGVVAVMSVKGGLEWGKIFRGLIPDLSLLFSPAPSLSGAIEASGDYSEYWSKTIAEVQRGKIITAFATAVGINMTFLLPYSMLKKGWGKAHRGLAIFDLSLGLIIPFVIATACVVIASASQFHGKSEDVFKAVESGKGKSVGSYNKYLDARIAADPSANTEFDKLQLIANKAAKGSEAKKIAETQVAAFRSSLPLSDRKLAAMIAERGNLRLADTLAPLTGQTIAQTVFGIGVLGMALSTIIMLMLINGFAVCEMFGVAPEGKMHRVGSLIPGVIGIFGPVIWAGAAAALATPTSVLGGAMLPIAYLSFFLMMNSRSMLGDAMPTGARRIKWNILMGFATSIATFASIWGIWNKSFNGIPMGKIGVGILVVLLIVGISGFLSKERKAKADAQLIAKD